MNYVKNSSEVVNEYAIIVPQVLFLTSLSNLYPFKKKMKVKIRENHQHWLVVPNVYKINDQVGRNPFVTKSI